MRISNLLHDPDAGSVLRSMRRVPHTYVGYSPRIDLWENAREDGKACRGMRILFDSPSERIGFACDLLTGLDRQGDQAADVAAAKESLRKALQALLASSS